MARGNRRETRAAHKMRADFRALCEAENRPCWLCGGPIDYQAAYDDWDNDDRFELDHRFPVESHPELQHDPENAEASHAGCNRARGAGDAPAHLGVPSQEWV